MDINTDPARVIQRARTYLIQAEIAGIGHQVDEDEFIGIYTLEGGTLEQAWRVARARKNQRGAIERISRSAAA